MWAQFVAVAVVGARNLRDTGSNPRNFLPADKRALLQEGRAQGWPCLTSPFSPQGKLADAAWPAGGVFLNTVPYKMCDKDSRDLADVADKWGNVDCWNFPWLAALTLPTLQGKQQSRGLFVDAGMNVGTCSMLALALGHRVVAFEPSRQCVVGALLSAEANGVEVLERLEVRQQLLSDSSAGAAVFQCKSTDVAPCGALPYQVVEIAACNAPGKALPSGSGQVATPPELLARFPGKTFAPFSGHEATGMPDEEEGAACYQTVRLDRVVKEYVAVLKVDVDGSEMAALRGARALFLARQVGALHIELVQSELKSIGTSFADVRALVEGEYGYTMFAMVSCPTCQAGSVTAGTAHACATSLGEGNAWLRKGFERQYQQHNVNDGRPIACPAGQCLAMGHYLVPVDQYADPGRFNYLFAAVSPALVQRAKETAREAQSRCLPGDWNAGAEPGVVQAVRAAVSVSLRESGREWGVAFAPAFVVFVLVGWRVVRCCLARRVRSRGGHI